jgi:hypothetical protein
MQTGMSQDWSWSRSAREYVKVYERTLEQKRASRKSGGRRASARRGPKAAQPVR